MSRLMGVRRLKMKRDSWERDAGGFTLGGKGALQL
jgi:hypothetical protein